jgi:hypothetical protein
MFSAVYVDRLVRVAKAVACFVLAAVILRTGYRLPPTTGSDILPELMCVFTAFFLGLTAVVLALQCGGDADNLF